MVAKLMKILENFGAILTVAAFLLWSGDWWKLSNKLFVFAIALLTPVIIWKTWYRDWKNWIKVIIGYIALILIGSWWFGKKDIKANIPGLPEITIHR